MTRNIITRDIPTVLTVISKLMDISEEELFRIIDAVIKRNVCQGNLWLLEQAYEIIGYKTLEACSYSAKVDKRAFLEELKSNPLRILILSGLSDCERVYKHFKTSKGFPRLPSREEYNNFIESHGAYEMSMVNGELDPRQYDKYCIYYKEESSYPTIVKLLKHIKAEYKLGNIKIIGEWKEGVTEIATPLENVLAMFKIVSVPEEIVSQYENIDSVEISPKDKRVIKAYLYSIQGYTRQQIAEKVGYSTDSLNNISNYVKEGKEVAEKYGLPSIEEYRTQYKKRRIN